MTLFAETANRVADGSADEIDRWISEEAAWRLERIGNDPAAIAVRLDALDREWDIERALQLNAAALVVAGSALAVAFDRRFIAIPAVVGAFLLQHAVQGWCPPLPLLRRLGFRTAREIADERHELLRRQEVQRTIGADPRPAG